MDNELMAFIAALGGQAQTTKKPRLAPGGLASARPAPSKIRSQDGVSDSAFVQQIIQTAQQMQGGAQPLLTMGNGMGMPPQQQPMMQPQEQPQQQGGGMAGLLQMLGGMG